MTVVLAKVANPRVIGSFWLNSRTGKKIIPDAEKRGLMSSLCILYYPLSN